MNLTVPLTESDMAMVALFRGRQHVKKHHIVSAFALGQQETFPHADAQFERLKHLGVIDHKRDGRCWLSEAFKAQMAAEQHARSPGRRVTTGGEAATATTTTERVTEEQRHADERRASAPERAAQMAREAA